MVNLGPQCPRRMLATIDFGALEHHQAIRFVAGTDHPQTLGAGEGADHGSQFDLPGRILSDPLGPMNQRAPLPIALEIAYLGEQDCRLAVGSHLGDDLHGNSLAGGSTDPPEP